MSRIFSCLPPLVLHRLHYNVTSDWWKKGLSQCHAAAFFFIPYLCQAGPMLLSLTLLLPRRGCSQPGWAPRLSRRSERQGLQHGWSSGVTSTQHCHEDRADTGGALNLSCPDLQQAVLWVRRPGQSSGKCWVWGIRSRAWRDPDWKSTERRNYWKLQRSEQTTKTGFETSCNWNSLASLPAYLPCQDSSPQETARAVATAPQGRVRHRWRLPILLPLNTSRLPPTALLLCHAFVGEQLDLGEQLRGK